MTAKTNGSQSSKTLRRKENQSEKREQDAESTKINLGHLKPQKPDASWSRIDEKPLSGRPIKSRGIVIKKFGHADFELTDKDTNATDAIRYELFRYIIGRLEYAQHIQGGTSKPSLIDGRQVIIDGKPLTEIHNAKIIYGYAGDISDLPFASLVADYSSIVSQEKVAKSQTRLALVLVVLTVFSSIAAIAELLRFLNILH